MKKLAVLFVCVAMLASCDSFKGGSKDLKAENDSLLMELNQRCLLYTSPSPRDPKTSRMPSSA